jgi:hypothetical protein
MDICLGHVRFWQQCCWKYRSPGMWCWDTGGGVGGGWFLKFWRDIIPSSGVKQFKRVQGDSSWTHSENKGSTFCRNVGNNSPNETTASKSWRSESSLPVSTIQWLFAAHESCYTSSRLVQPAIYTRHSRLFQVILSIMLQLSFLRPFSVSSSVASTKWMLISQSE